MKSIVNHDLLRIGRGGLAFFVLQSGDANEAYETLGRNVNGLKARHFDAFWTCAFSSFARGLAGSMSMYTGARAYVTAARYDPALSRMP